ncbi:MAG: putative metallopeptidase [Candidatus Woesearchaeota archaeon]
MSRFEEATGEPYEIVNGLIGEHFPELSGAKFEIVFDTKKRKSAGRIVFARIQSTNDLAKYFTADQENPDGVDYILYIDKNLWNNITSEDKKRLIYHELCHCDVDLDKKKPFGIKDHDIQMFESEINYNNDDPRWTLRLASFLDDFYEQQKE